MSILGWRKGSALEQWISLRHKARGFRKSDGGRKAGTLQWYRWETSSSKVCIEDWEFARSVKAGQGRTIYWIIHIGCRGFCQNLQRTRVGCMSVILEFLNNEGKWVRAANFTTTWSSRFSRVWQWGRKGDFSRAHEKLHLQRWHWRLTICKKYQILFTE